MKTAKQLKTKTLNKRGLGDHKLQECVVISFTTFTAIHHSPSFPPIMDPHSVDARGTAAFSSRPLRAFTCGTHSSTSTTLSTSAHHLSPIGLTFTYLPSGIGCMQLPHGRQAASASSLPLGLPTQSSTPHRSNVHAST
eukprot:2363400-Amphidinium_carterae.3